MFAVSRRLTANSLFVTGLPVSGPNFASNASPNLLLSPVSPMSDKKDLSTTTLLPASGELVSASTSETGIFSFSISVFLASSICASAKFNSAASTSLVTSTTAASARYFLPVLGSSLLLV